jgi:heterodisulfide reductase subunit B
MHTVTRDVDYFPGCSLSSAAKENNDALDHVFQHLDYNLVELEDWNCCGTFLSVARPEIVTLMVNKIVRDALDAGANLIVTACAMCQMNIEVRCNFKEQRPIIPLSQMLTLAMHLEPLKHKKMLVQHLVDPRPLLRSIGLI